MVDLKDWVKRNKIFLLSILLIFIFAIIDIAYVDGVMRSGIDSVFNIAGGTIRTLWWVALGAVAATYYLLKRDKSETAGLFLASGIMLISGLEDWFFMLIKPHIGCMTWLQNTGASLSSQYLLKQSCLDFTGLTLNVVLGVLSAYLVYDYLRRKY
jgi:hypothetical protein